MVSSCWPLAAARIATLPVDAGAATDRSGLAVYVTQDGLRPGVVLGAVLLTIPVLALALQALRVGFRPRERRMASLQLARATQGDVQLIAAAETGAAALLGAVLAGPAYLALWLLLGVLPPAGLRLVPAPALLDLVVWLALLPAGTAAGRPSHRHRHRHREWTDS